MKAPTRKKGNTKRLDQTAIANIISRARQGETLSSIARAHGVTQAAVSYHVAKQRLLSPVAKPEAPHLKNHCHLMKLPVHYQANFLLIRITRCLQ